MIDTNTNTTNAKPGKFELIKNYETGFWELVTPTITYVIAELNNTWVDTVYKIGRAIENYYGRSSAILPETIEEIEGVEQLVGWR